ncbi:hypothetical protein PFMC_04633 [Plasmodium falciparum CAMP/Malaysia]|uniref:Uncharacterized protein n=1 Tax=Plasmodium falciparum (isolate Camp / Malaysia) TaxID=5835 RepID=A0A024X306_PLAFC|nr:hypothetical protein PFMC_04633 [Plasmodium falciparum CAMP/Malaysia]
MFRKYFGCTGDLYVLNEIFMNKSEKKKKKKKKKHIIYIYIYIL